jgi:hypothetical protein
MFTEGAITDRPEGDFEMPRPDDVLTAMLARTGDMRCGRTQ